MSSATLLMDGPSTAKGGPHSELEDFLYGANVAQAHISIRLGFLRKVYGILTAQLLVTTLMASVTMFTPIIRFYVNENEWTVMFAFVVSMATLLLLMVKRRQTPINYILLAIFTLAQGCLISTVVTYYDQLVVLEAFVLTLGVTFGLTLYTFQSRRDFSKWGAGLTSMLMILVFMGFLQMFSIGTQYETLLAAVGAALFSAFIVHDTHMIMHRLSPEEYVTATIDLYLDIINLFLELLRLLDRIRKH